MHGMVFSISAALHVAALGAQPSVDFDGREKGKTAVKDMLREVTGSPGQGFQNAVHVRQSATFSRKAFRKGRNGFELVAPIVNGDGKSVYEFMPNDVSYWDFSCAGAVSKGQADTWGFCWVITFQPAKAGHNHSPATALSYLDPATGKLLPNRICRSGLVVGAHVSIDFKAPVYSSLVGDTVEFSGACPGTLNDEDHVTVAKNGVIQLATLDASPYLAFKTPDPHHATYLFGTPDTNEKLKKIASEYYEIYKPTSAELITVTDIGLPWGGRYQTEEPHDCWVDGQLHFCHRYGRQVDVRSWNIPAERRKCFEEIACKYLVEPILEGKAPRTLPQIDYARVSTLEADMYDRAEHYHLNFARPTDPPVVPRDDARTSCPGVIPAGESACPSASRP